MTVDFAAVCKKTKLQPANYEIYRYTELRKRVFDGFLIKQPF